MRRFAATFVFLSALLVAHAATPLFTVDNVLLPSPAGIGARAVQLTTSAEGHTHVSWIESLPKGAALYFATLEPKARRWSKPRSITSTAGLSCAENEAPQLVAYGTGSTMIFTAVWTELTGGNRTIARWSTSADDGKTWSASQPLTTESTSQHFPALTALADGRLLATWADSRGLCSRVILPASGSDVMVDPSANPGSRLTPIAGNGSGAWVVYRRLVAGEKRDIGLARYDGNDWTLSKALELNREADALPAPTDGPVIAGTPSRLAVVWFTTTERDPRLLVSQSAGADGPFLIPSRVDDVRPVGHPTLVLLNDGTTLVAWLEHYDETGTAIWLRHLAPSGELSAPVLLATAPSVTTFPRLAVREAPADGRAQLLLAFTVEAGGIAQVVTRLITLSPPSAMTEDKPCNCPGAERMSRGHALRGIVRESDAHRTGMVIQHAEIVGVLPAGATFFKTEPEILILATAGAEVVGRIEQQGNDWWLFDARLIIRGKPRSTPLP